ncbi:MAG TPA: VacJ family lipoprotein [Pseudoxanthomonas sp.]|nr:VacJ family lipoprotein [Pseudoxanthomonas sp.]
MNRIVTGGLLPLLLLAGCASAPRQPAAPVAPVAPAAEAAPATHPLPAPAPADATAPVVAGEAAPAPDASGTSTVAPAAEATAAPTEAEDDFAALYGTPEAPAAGGDGPAPRAYDPWEPMNRRVHAFNEAVDHAIARPLARAYVAVVPHPVRLGVTNFFDNLGSPLTMVNQLLQGRPRDAVQTLGRFVVNSTLGIGGIFDPASDLKMKRRAEDFGQTLGVWGWRNSRYVELPFFGPRTLRDVVGLAGDMPLSPTRQVEEDKVRIALQGLQLVDTRVQLLSLDALREAAPDEYAMTRDAWLQRRNYQIGAGRERQADGELPDYLREEERDPTVPADAMPLPGG